MLRRGSTVDTDAVRAAVGAVHDPEIGRPLAELGMLGDIHAERGGRVRITVRLTTATCPFTERLRADIATAAHAVPEVGDVRVEFGELAVRERVELAAALRRESTPVTGTLGGGPTVYAVASGKGGVGKSTVTANLAAAQAATGKRVGVLDADVWGYSIPQLFGIGHNPVTVGGLMMPPRAHGVALMSMGFLVPDGEPVVWRGPMLHKALQQFLTDTHWGELDTLFIDLPPGTGDITLSVLELLPDAALLAVTTPQRAARTVAARVVRMALDANMPITGVIENMTAVHCSTCDSTEPVFGSGGGAELAEQAGAPLLGQIPLDRPAREAGDRGTPVVLDAPAAHSATELRRIAEHLPAPRRSLLGRTLPLAVV